MHKHVPSNMAHSFAQHRLDRFLLFFTLRLLRTNHEFPPHIQQSTGKKRLGYRTSHIHRTKSECTRTHSKPRRTSTAQFIVSPSMRWMISKENREKRGENRCALYNCSLHRQYRSETSKSSRRRAMFDRWVYFFGVLVDGVCSPFPSVQRALILLCMPHNCRAALKPWI